MRYFIYVVFASFLPILANAEGRTCPALAIKKSEINSIVERRQSTFKHCLACVDDQCTFKQWPAEGKEFEQACRLLFCAPTKMPRKMFINPKSAEEGGVFFTFGISKEGRVKDVKITDLVGEVTESEALQHIDNLFERRRYEPIEINGKRYELTGLRDGNNYRINWKTNVN